MFYKTDDPFTVLPYCISLSLLPFDFSSSLLLSLWPIKEPGIQAPIRWLFWGASLPSSQSAGSPIKVFSLPQVTYSGLAGSYLNIWAPTLGKGKIPGTFWLKVQFPNTHTKEVKSQGLLLTNPRKGGRRSSDLGEGELSTPGHKHGGRK